MPIWISSGPWSPGPGRRRRGRRSATSRATSDRRGAGRPGPWRPRRTGSGGSGCPIRPQRRSCWSPRSTAAGSRSGRCDAFRIRKRYALRDDLHVRVGGAVDHRGVHEALGHQRRVRRAGVTGSAVGTVRSGLNDRPEPRAVVPAAHRVGAHRVGRVLVRHVDVREPQAAQAAPVRRVPGGVLRRELGGVGHERLVLDDERDLLRRDRAGRDGQRADRPAVDERLLDRIVQQVAGGLARVHVQAGDAVRVVVIEHQPGALLVRVEEGERARAGIRHVGDVVDADALGIRRVLAGRRRPLVRRAVADPRGRAAVQVERGAVLRVEADAVGARAGAHRGRVDRQEQVAAGAGRELVDELDADRAVLVRDDRRPEVARRRQGRHAAAVHLHVALELRRGQVAVKLLAVPHERDHVVVGARIRGRVRHRDRDVVAEVVRLRGAESRQGVDELADPGPGDRVAARVQRGQRAQGPVRDRRRSSPASRADRAPRARRTCSSRTPVRPAGPPRAPWRLDRLPPRGPPR